MKVFERRFQVLCAWRALLPSVLADAHSDVTFWLQGDLTWSSHPLQLDPRLSFAAELPHATERGAA